MSFLHRQRSHQALQNPEKEAKRSSKLFPSPAAIENVPQKRKRQRTGSSSASGASRIIRRVSSMFLRKKPPLELKHVDTALANTPYRFSSSSSRDSFESEDDIRRPSGLGRAVSIASNRSLPPSPFTPTAPHDNFPTFSAGEFQRMRAVSSPNLLRSSSFKFRWNARRASISPYPHPPTLSIPSPKRRLQLPEVVVVHILSHLAPQTVSRCAPISRLFASAARTSLYTYIDTGSFSLLQVERLVVLLASRSDLTDLVSTFVCPRWPPFFLSNTRLRDGHSIKQQDALLTATFTLALERMSSLVSLTLPAFDASLLAHHTAFGLTSLTFLNPTMSEAETTALFTWLDGQINIATLRFPNLEDTHLSSPLSPKANLPEEISGAAPSSPHLKPFPTLSPHATPTASPSSASFHMPSTPETLSSPFNSPTLLPSLMEFQGTPFLFMHLFPSLDTAIRRPLKAVSLSITTTLYSGLRPAALMSSLRSIRHLSLRFSDNVDRRSFEKVLGAAGAALGCTVNAVADDPFSDAEAPLSEGLHDLDISFHAPATGKSGRDEALYKSLQASLPRYKTLSSLRLSISSTEGFPTHLPSANEEILIYAWVKLCPTLTSVTLFSNARWQRSCPAVI